MAETRTIGDWASHASTPTAIPPHPPLQSGGWYHGATSEAPGPGRLPLTRKSPGVAVGLAVLFGPAGLAYLSASWGVVGTVLALAVLGYFGSFLPLLLIWPVAVAVAVWGGRHR